MLIFDPIETWKKTKLKGGSYRIRKMLIPVFQKGVCVYQSPSVMDIQAYCRSELNTLWDESKRLEYPHSPYVDLSKKLWDVKNRLLDQYHGIER